MILYEISGQSENAPAYRDMEVANVDRLHRFLESAVQASITAKRLQLSQTVIKAFNYHAIACLHAYAGEYRPCEVSVGEYRPPAHYRVGALMEDFVDRVNRNWEKADPIQMSAYVLWRLNHIHPFINGNGRTARAACYFVLCLKHNEWIPGTPDILPEILKRNRAEYVDALKKVDRGEGSADLERLIHDLLRKQLGLDP